MEWQLQDAKNRFSELVQRARKDGPQIVTLRGERAAVVLSAEAFDALTARAEPRRSSPRRPGMAGRSRRSGQRPRQGRRAGNDEF